MFIFSRRVILIVNTVLVCALLVVACATPTQTPPVPDTVAPKQPNPPSGAVLLNTEQSLISVPTTPQGKPQKVLLIFAIEDGKDSEKLNDKCLSVSDTYEITKAYLNLLRQYFEQGVFVPPPVPNITTKVVRFSNIHYVSDAQPEELLPATSIDKLRSNQINAGLIRPLPDRNYQIIKKEKVFSYLDSESTVADFTEKVVIYFTDGNFQLPKGDNDDYAVEWDKFGNPTNYKKNVILREENQTAAQTSLEKIKDKWSVFPVLRCDLASLPDTDNRQWWNDYEALGLNSPIRPWQPKDRFEQTMSGIWRNVLSKYMPIPLAGEFGRIYLAKDERYFDLNEQVNWEKIARCTPKAFVDCIGFDLSPIATKFTGGEIAIAHSPIAKEYLGKLWVSDSEPKLKSDLTKIASVRWDELIKTPEECKIQKWGFQPPDPKSSVGERTLFWWRATPARITTTLLNQGIQYSADNLRNQTTILATIQIDGDENFSPNFGKCFQVRLWQWESGRLSRPIGDVKRLTNGQVRLENTTEFSEIPPLPPKLDVVVEVSPITSTVTLNSRSQPAEVTVKYIPGLIADKDKTSCPLNSVNASQATPPLIQQSIECKFMFKYTASIFKTPPLQVFVERKQEFQKDNCFSEHLTSQELKINPSLDLTTATLNLPLKCGISINRVAISWFTPPSKRAGGFDEFIGWSTKDITPWVCDAKGCRPY